MALGVDTVHALDPVAMVDAGVTAIGRYLPTENQRYGCTRAELDAYRAHGLDVWLIFEESGNEFLGGAPAGVDNATRAMRARDSLGLSAVEITIYCALIDGSPSVLNGHADALAGYSGAWGGTVDGDGFGGYGSVQAVRVARAATPRMVHAWGVGTWGWGEGPTPAGELPAVLVEPADVIQHGNRPQLVIGGVTCDQDTLLTSNYGQWRRPLAWPPNTEDSMISLCWNAKTKKLVAVGVGTEGNAFYAEQSSDGTWSEWREIGTSSAFRTFVVNVTP